MKILFLSTLILLLSCALESSPGSDARLPLLYSWYPSWGHPVKLENFDSTGQNSAAIGLFTFNYNDSTRLFRSPTEFIRDYYFWKYGAPKLTGHFSGKFIDYLSNDGHVYFGKADNAIPRSDTIAKLPIKMVYDAPVPNAPVYPMAYSYDLNDDSLDDLVLFTYDVSDGSLQGVGQWGVLGKGTPDINHMTFVPIYPPDTYVDIKKAAHVWGMYRVKNQYRVVWTEDNTDYHLLCLGSLTLQDTAAFVKRLQSVHFNTQDYEYLNWVYPLCLYYDSKSEEADVLASRRNAGPNSYTQGLSIFSLANDSISFMRTYPDYYFDTYTLPRGSRDNDDPMWIARSGPLKANDSTTKLNFFVGSPLSPNKIGTYPLIATNPVGGSLSNVVRIGDIDGDGKDDIALDYDGSSMEIVRAASSISGIVGTRDTSSSIVIPQLITIENTEFISFTSRSACDIAVDLYTVDGKFVTRITTSNVSYGFNKVPFVVHGNNISAGQYLVKVSGCSLTYGQIVIVTR